MKFWNKLIRELNKGSHRASIKSVVIFVLYEVIFFSAGYAIILEEKKHDFLTSSNNMSGV